MSWRCNGQTMHLEHAKEWSIRENQEWRATDRAADPSHRGSGEKKEGHMRATKSLSCSLVPAGGHLVEPRGAWGACWRAARRLGLVEGVGGRQRPRPSITNWPGRGYRLPDSDHQTLHAVGGEARTARSYEMRDLHIHDLRRTLGSWLASSGTNLPIIGRGSEPQTRKPPPGLRSIDRRSGS